MKKRKLGNSDLELSVIGLGTWAIGGEWKYGWGPQDDRESKAAILEALEQGINWIDTAAVYGLGHSEEIVGKALQEWGKPVVVATKCGLLPGEGTEVVSSLKRNSIRREVEGSLKRLGLERIDLYQIHWPNPKSDIEEGFETLLELKQEGKIRYAGVSNFSKSQLETISPLGEITSLQSPYSFVHRVIEQDSLPWCREHGIGLLAYSPMQCGLLTEKFSLAWLATLPQGDFRKTHSPYFQEPMLGRMLTVVHELKVIARENQLSISQLVLAWLLDRQGVSSVIVGARKPGQILETSKAAQVVLSDTVITNMEKVFRSVVNV